MAHVEDGDARQHESVRGGEEDVVQVRIAERTDEDDEQLRDAGERAPERGLAGVSYL
jgi:hypothetical protein